MSVVKSLNDDAPKASETKTVKNKKVRTAASKKAVAPVSATIAHTAIQETPTPAPAIEPAPTSQKESEVEIIEEKASGIWSKIKSWKYFWFLVIGLALLIIGYLFLSNYIRNRQNQKSEEKIEAKKEELHQIEVGGDTSILKQRIIESNRMKRIDSIYNATLHALTDLKKVLDYEKLTLPKQSDIINDEYIRAHENINNPGNSDDDVRRNAEGQMSKQKTNPGR